MPCTTKTLNARIPDEVETPVVMGEVKRELMRTDPHGRRYLRFSVVHSAGSTRCYWFIGAGSRVDSLKHGDRYRVQGETHLTGDREVLVVQAFQAIQTTAAKEEARKQERTVRHSAISRLRAVPNRLRLFAQLSKTGE